MKHFSQRGADVNTELMNKVNYDMKADLYSLGVIAS